MGFFCHKALGHYSGNRKITSTKCTKKSSGLLLKLDVMFKCKTLNRYLTKQWQQKRCFSQSSSVAFSPLTIT